MVHAAHPLEVIVTVTTSTTDLSETPPFFWVIGFGLHAAASATVAASGLQGRRLAIYPDHRLRKASIAFDSLQRTMDLRDKQLGNAGTLNLWHWHALFSNALRGT